MTPQREYPAFSNPSFRELGVPIDGSSSDHSRTSFRDADGQGIWKEIHTDSGGQCSSGGGSVATNIPTPSSLEQSPRPRPSHSSNSAYVEPPTVLTSPSNHAVGGGGRSIAVNTTGSKNYYYRHGMLRRGPKVPHSTQNVNILSPQQLRPLEKSPNNKLTLQLHIANPQVTEELTVSPEQGAAGPAYDHDVEQLHHTNMLPPAAAARSPHQVTLGSPVGTPMSSSTKPKKMVKSRVDQKPRPSVSKDRSPDRSWKSSFRAVSPAVAATATTLQNNAARGMRRELNSSFQGNNSGRAASAAAAAACVNLHYSSSVPRWRGCGDSGAQAMVAPVRDHRETCQGDLSGELERPNLPHKVVGGKQKLSSASTPKSSSYNIFSLLSWSKKKPSTGITTMSTKRQPTATEPFLEYSDDYFGGAKADSDSNKVLDYTIKTLRRKLEQANQKRATALDEVYALQSALEASEEKCRQLTRRCLDLELQFSARSSGLWDMSGPEERTNNAATYIVGPWREPNPALHVAATLFPRPSHQELLNPEQFLQVFEDAIANLRKLASANCHHIRENGESATQVITALLEQHKVGRAVARMPHNVIILYFESFLTRSCLRASRT